MFIIATANKEFKLTAGKFVPVSNVTTLNVCNTYVYMYVLNNVNISVTINHSYHYL
jgi:hypothetical protein